MNNAGAESVVCEAVLYGKKVAAKKPHLSTADHLDKFHKELQLLRLIFIFRSFSILIFYAETIDV